MSEHDDEYLWSGQGSASEDVAALERSLASLRWRPHVLALPNLQVAEVTEVAEVVALDRARERRSVEVDGASASWWPAVITGLVAAAAVLALLLWPGPDAAVRDSAPTVHPTAPPTSPDLKDPFGPRESAGLIAPITDPDRPVAPSVSPDLMDPFGGRVDPPTPPISPDLKDPFGGRSDPDLKDPFGNRSDPPASPEPELKDPFGGVQDEPAPAGELVDPFGARRDASPTTSSTTSPDLADPFSP